MKSKTTSYFVNILSIFLFSFLSARGVIESCSEAYFHYSTHNFIWIEYVNIISPLILLIMIFIFKIRNILNKSNLIWLLIWLFVSSFWLFQEILGSYSCDSCESKDINVFISWVKLFIHFQ
jgi:hypothetical protein